MTSLPDTRTASPVAPDAEPPERGMPVVGGHTLTFEQALDACLDGATLLTVNRRLSRDLGGRCERMLFESGATWWQTPAILPLARWLERLHDEALTLGLSSRTRLPPLVVERRWHASIERDHAVTLLSPLATARQAVRAWRLGNAWGCLPGEDDYLPVDQYHWRRWAAEHVATLDADALVDEATLIDHLVAVIGTGGLPLPERVVLAGFLNPTPASRRLVDALEAAGVTVAYVAGGTPCTPRSVLWPDDAGELAGIADAVRQRLDRDPEAVLGVVIPDLDARRGEVLRAFDRRFFPAMTPSEIERAERPYDLSLGQPLADVAVVRTALLALRLVLGTLEQRDLATLLLSPHLGAHEAECHDREHLDGKLRDERVQRLDLAGFAARLGGGSSLRRGLYGLLDERRRQRFPRRASATEWTERFARHLEAFGWAEDDLGSEEFQALQAWRGVLGDLRTLDDGDELGAFEALGLIRHLAAERLFQPETADLPVRILGRLESHGQRFDALWVAGLDTERWPPSGSPNPFLPIAAQKEAGMPEASGGARLELAQAEFVHWCGAAPELVASRAAEREGNALHSANVLGELEIGRVDELQPAALVARVATLEAVDDAAGPLLQAGDSVAGGARLFEDQAACPFRAFAAHRLRARPLEEVAGGIDSRQAGTVLHRSLELLWRDLRTHATLLTAAADGTLGSRVDTAVEAALESEGVAIGWRALERRRLGPLLRHWLEENEVPRVPFEVVAFESTRETVRGGVRVRLAIDRMDRLVGAGAPLQGTTDDEAGDAALPGPRIVLDYKSGTRNTVEGWTRSRIEHPQLPLYALTNDDVTGVGYAQVATNACRFKGIASGGVLPGVRPDATPWSEHRAHWGEVLDGVGGEIAAGRAEVRPAKGACRYCELRALCRLDAGDELEADDEDAADGPGTSAS